MQMQTSYMHTRIDVLLVTSYMLPRPCVQQHVHKKHGGIFPLSHFIAADGSEQINALIRLRQLRESLALFCHFAGRRRPLPLHTYAALLSACAELKDLEKGSQIHGELSSLGLVGPDPFLGTALVDMYAKCGSFDDAGHLVRAFPVQNIATRNALISGYVHHHRFVDALRSFECMKSAGVSPDAVTFCCILRACSGAGDIVTGIEIHAEVCRKGLLDTNCYLGSALIKLYAENRQLTVAQDVFDELLVRNVVIWTVLINGYVMNDCHEEAIERFEEMQIAGFAPNAVTFACVVKACGSIGAMDDCGQIYAELCRRGLVGNDPLLGTALVDCYAKWGFVNAAREIFDRNSARNEVIWTALVSGYAERGLGREALASMERMKAESISPNARTYVSALKGCNTLKGMQIHASVSQELVPSETDLFLGTALVGMYAKCGKPDMAWAVFDMLLPVRNVVAWSALIMGYARNRQDEDALKCFRMMQEEGVDPNEVTLACALASSSNVETVGKMQGETLMKDAWKHSLLVGATLIDAYAKCGSLAKAREVFESLAVRDVVAWNALISGYVQHRHNREAFECIGRMEIEGIPPSAVTMCSIIKACGDTGSMEATEKLHVEAAGQGFLQTDLFVGSALVDAYCKCGALSKAREVFDGLLIRNHVTWSALITGCAKRGDVANAILTLTRMMDEGGHEPDHATFVSILNAFDGAGYVDEGHAWLMTMVRHWEMPPSMSHYACMIDLMARAGQLEKALMMIVNIPCPPDSHMWLSIMAACHTRGHADLCRQAFKHAVQLDAMDVAAHVSMANTFAQADVFMHLHHDLVD